MACVYSTFYRVAAALIVRAVPRFIKSISGLQNVPERGPCVLVANHISPFDHLLIGAVIYIVFARKVYFVAKEQLFDGWLSRLWGNSMGAIPINQKRWMPGSYKRILDCLNKGGILCVYPEGSIGRPGHLLPFKRGAIWIADQSEVPVVPVGILGTDLILRRGQYIPRWHLASLAIGTILDRGPTGDPLHSHASDRVREAIKCLTEEATSPVYIVDDVRACVGFLKERACFLQECASKGSPLRRDILRQASRILSLAERIDQT